VCGRLNDSKSFVSLIGVYSTREYPFALVFGFMDHMNLRGYLRHNQNVGRLDLVYFYFFTLAIYNSLISPPVIADRSWSGVYAQPRYNQWKSQDRASHVRTPTSNMCSRSFRLMSLWVTADIPASQV